MSPAQVNPSKTLLRNFGSDSLGRERRTMRQFAEEEIILPPGGPLAGDLFSCETQPYTKLWFDAIDSGEWRESSGGEIIMNW